MNLDEMQALIAEYVQTLDNKRYEEQYETRRTFATSELEEFAEWLKKRVS